MRASQQEESVSFRSSIVATTPRRVDNYDTGGLTIWPQCCNDAARPTLTGSRFIGNKPASRKGRAQGVGPATLSASIQSINCCREARVSSSPVNSLRNVVAIAAGIVVSRSSRLVWLHSLRFPNDQGEDCMIPHVVQKRLAPSVPPIVVRNGWQQCYHSWLWRHCIILLLSCHP